MHITGFKYNENFLFIINSKLLKIFNKPKKLILLKKLAKTKNLKHSKKLKKCSTVFFKKSIIIKKISCFKIFCLI